MKKDKYERNNYKYWNNVARINRDFYSWILNNLHNKENYKKHSKKEQYGRVGKEIHFSHYLCCFIYDFSYHINSAHWCSDNGLVSRSGGNWCNNRACITGQSFITCKWNCINND